MLILLGVAVLILAGAVVVLFAMLGELASRLPPDAGRRSRSVRPLVGARIGHEPGDVPVGLAHIGHRASSVVLVLSTACSACEDVAAQLAAERTEAPESTEEFSIVISTAEPRQAEDFVARHRLDRFPYVIDEGGDWIRAELGVRTSPSALVFHNGRLVAAHVFADVNALRTSLPTVMSTPEETTA